MVMLLLLKGSSRGSNAGKACALLYSFKSGFILVVTKTAGWSQGVKSVCMQICDGVLLVCEGEGGKSQWRLYEERERRLSCDITKRPHHETGGTS